MKKAQSSKKTAPDRAVSRQTMQGSASPDGEWLTQSRALFLIIAGVVVVYANSLGGAFVFDDTKQIVANPQLHSWANIFHAFTSDVWNFQRATFTKDIPPPYYRPLFTAYLTVGYKLFGLWEPGWHLMNLAVHTGATVAVYFLLRRLTNGNQIIATLGALIFGLHPAHVESVSWISGIPDPLAALFYVPSLLWYIRYREEGNKKFLLASVIFYGLSALCKETPLALPIVICVWELARNSNPFITRIKRLVLQLIPFAVMAAAYLAMRFAVLGRISWKHPFMARVPDSAIWMTVPYVFINYLRHLVAPFYLSLIYGTSFITEATDARFITPALLLVALIALLWIYRRKIDAQTWLALALIVAPLLPVLNLRVFHYEYIIQDRYLYLPSIGFSYLVALLIVRLARRSKQLATAISVIVLLAFGVSTVMQNRVWHDSVALWQRAVYYSPDSWSTHYNLGLAYLNINQNQAARAELTAAQRLKPGEALIYNNLALAEAAMGDKEGAIANLRQGLALDPHMLEAHNNLGAFLFDKGDYEGAKKEFAQALEADPTSVSAHFNLARALAASGDQPAAIREYETVLAKEPEDVAARYQLGLSYAAVGRKSDAMQQFERALQTDRDAERAAAMRQQLERIRQSQ